MNDTKAEALRQAVSASSKDIAPEAIVLTAQEFEKYLNSPTPASDSTSEKTPPRAVGFLADHFDS